MLYIPIEPSYGANDGDCVSREGGIVDAGDAEGIVDKLGDGEGIGDRLGDSVFKISTAFWFFSHILLFSRSLKK